MKKEKKKREVEEGENGIVATEEIFPNAELHQGTVGHTPFGSE